VEFARSADLGGEARMSKPNSFKRRLLRAAVQENVDVIHNAWFRLSPRRLPRRLAWSSRGVMFGVAVALLPLLYAVTTISENRLEGVQFSVAQDPKFVEPTPPAGDAVPPTPAVSSASVSESLYAPLTPVLAPSLIDPETLVSVPQPLDLAALALPVKKIVIDPGHGGDDPGAVSSQGLTEKELSLDIGLRLRDLLVASAFDVRMTRERDTTIPLVQRVVFANQEEGDLFVSIHVNWVEPRRTRVVETYYLGPTEDSTALQLSGIENQHSGYSLTDFRRLLEQVYFDVKRGESRKLAEAVQNSLVQTLQEANPILKSQAVKTAPFVVLVGANMPAILTEVACLSNEKDARLLTSPEYRQQIAQALFTGIRAYTATLYHTNMTRKDASS